MISSLSAKRTWSEVAAALNSGSSSKRKYLQGEAARQHWESITSFPNLVFFAAHFNETHLQFLQGTQHTNKCNNKMQKLVAFFTKIPNLYLEVFFCPLWVLCNISPCSYDALKAGSVNNSLKFLDSSWSKNRNLKLVKIPNTFGEKKQMCFSASLLSRVSYLVESKENKLLESGLRV